MVSFSLAIIFLSTLAGLYNAQILPEYSVNITAYHLNPLKAGAVPLNMNSGDALGDLGFYLAQFFLPVECQGPYMKTDQRALFDCANGERVDPDLVVTKVEMTIDKRTTEYSICNLCVNGSDPGTLQPCDHGTLYACDCVANMTSPGGGDCEKGKVGVELLAHAYPNATTKQCEASMQKACGNLISDPNKCVACMTEHAMELFDATCDMTDWYNFCPGSWGVWHTCNASTPEWVCWGDNIPFKTRGHWYATTKQGLCDESSSPGSCSWKVSSTQTIKETCLKEKIVARVVSADPDCFKPYSSRNSTGWIECFYDTLLGKEARHRLIYEHYGGLPISEVEKVWVDAFLPEENGGCPKVEIPHVSGQSKDLSLVV